MTTENRVEEYEVVKTSPKGLYEHHEKIVEDAEAARRQNIDRLVQFIWLVFSILEAALGLRFFLKVIAANSASPFAHLMYTLTNLFLWPFAGLTSSPAAGGMILEIPDLIAMTVYALLAWVLVTSVGILFARTSSRNVTIYERRRE
jgi:YggT family protein